MSHSDSKIKEAKKEVARREAIEIIDAQDVFDELHAEIAKLRQENTELIKLSHEKLDENKRLNEEIQELINMYNLIREAIDQVKEIFLKL